VIGGILSGENARDSIEYFILSPFYNVQIISLSATLR
jgi:hypothetical protein